MNMDSLNFTFPREEDSSISFCIKVQPVEQEQPKPFSPRKRSKTLNLGSKWAEVCKNYTPLKIVG